MNVPDESLDKKSSVAVIEKLKMFNEFQAQARLRTESTVKLILFISGSLLSLSVGAMLGKQDSIPSVVMPNLILAWELLFFSICSGLAVMLLMIVATFHMSTMWARKLVGGSPQPEIIHTWNPLRLLNAVAFISSAITCIAGVGAIGMVAIGIAESVVRPVPNVAEMPSTIFVSYSSGWWSALTSCASVLIGLLVGFFIAEWREQRARDRNKMQHFEALAAEIRMCGAIAKGFLSDSVREPAYRMGTIAYGNSLPSVLTYKEVNPEDRDALIRYYNNVLTFNRCLDYSHDAFLDARKDIDISRIDKENRRAKLKASKISAGGGSQYEAVILVLAKHLPADSLGPMVFDSQGEES